MASENIASNLEGANYEMSEENPAPPDQPSLPPPVPAGTKFIYVPQPLQFPNQVYASCIPQAVAPLPPAQPSRQPSVPAGTKFIYSTQPLQSPNQVYAYYTPRAVAPLPPAQPCLAPSVPAGTKFINQPQPLESPNQVYAYYNPQAVAPPPSTPPFMGPPRMNVGHPPPRIFPQQLHHRNTMVSSPQSMSHSAAGAHYVVGQRLCFRPQCNNGPVVPVAPQRSRQNTPSVRVKCKKKKKAKKIHDETQPYIKKPLNAFMIYKRVHIAATLRELKTTQHSIANKVLGKRWHNLPYELKKRYFNEAKTQRLHHADIYPHWSTSDNYGKYRNSKKNNSSSCRVQTESDNAHTPLVQPPLSQATTAPIVCDIAQPECQGIYQYDPPTVISAEFAFTAATGGPESMEQLESSPVNMQLPQSPTKVTLDECNNPKYRQAVEVQSPLSQAQETCPVDEASMQDLSDVRCPNSSTVDCSEALKALLELLEEAEIDMTDLEMPNINMELFDLDLLNDPVSPRGDTGGDFSL